MNNRAEFETSRKASGSGWVTRTLIMTLGILIGFTLFSSPANAQTVIPDVDPHGLIAHSEDASAYSISSDRPDRLAVWACHTRSGKKDYKVKPTQLVKHFKRVALPYFAWLSENRYNPEFVVGGTVTVAYETGCRAAVATRSSSESEEITGVIIMTDTPNVATKDGIPRVGYAHPGALCSGANSCTYPGNYRYTVLRSNRTPLRNSEFHDQTLLHEIGHMLNFPHSFSDGKPGGEYNNHMDIMSAGRTIDLGTLAVNRYAAGWIPTEQVQVHSVTGGDSPPVALYDLAYLGQPGSQMLVLPVQAGDFYALGARGRSEHDSDIPREGVEVYRINQVDCEYSKVDGWCRGVRRRTEPFIAVNRSNDNLGHVYRVGEDIALEDIVIQLRVLERTGSGYRIWVGPGPVRSGPLWRGDFFDDEGSVHEDSINLLAAAKITEGCKPYQFCPQDKVTRAQMVAFLARALGLTATTDRASTSDFEDVGSEDWYVGYLNALNALIPIATGDPDGRTFRPSEHITRGEMAIMLNRALSLDANGGRNAIVFADVPAGTELATAVANLAMAGITQGCESKPKPRFCPDITLSRAQMASLLARSPVTLDADDEEVRSDREIRIRVGKPSTRCPQDATCWGLHHDYQYEFIGDFDPAPYTLECWANDQLVWSGNWSGRPETGCYSWASGHTVQVVVDGVKSNKLRWTQPDEEEVGSGVREVRISVGNPSTRCPQGVTCLGLHHDYQYEFIGEFDPAPYTLECWTNNRRVWFGLWSGVPERGCYSWGSGQTVYVVVDGVKSNELLWIQPDEEIRPDEPDEEEIRPDGQGVQTEWHVNDDPILGGTERFWRSGQVGKGYGNNNYVYMFADSDASAPDNTALWEMGNRIGRQEIQVYIPRNNATATVDYKIRIHRADNTIIRSITRSVEQANERRWIPLGTIDSNHNKISILLEDNGARQDWETDGLLRSSIGIDAIRMRCVSNCTPDESDEEEIRPDDEETQPDGREVRIRWGADLSSDPESDIRDGCSGFVFCQAFNYELIGFGPGPHTYECLINDRPWPPYPVRGREGCRARGNHLIVAHVVVDGVKSDPLRWPRPG